MKAILVTGGAGYIGSHTCKALAHEGYIPVTFDNLSAGHEWAVKWGPFVRGDIRNAADVSSVFSAYDIDAVVHFAAHAYVGESMRNPKKYFRNNVVGTLNLLDAMVEHGVKTLVFSSSCATYGVPQVLQKSDGSAEITAISESTPQCPVNPYGESKLACERMIRWYGMAYGLRSVCLRYFNAAGADTDGELGEEHDPETHLIPLIFRAVTPAPEERDDRRVEPLHIFGTDYDTPDGTCIRDYIHVSDLANAHTLSLKYLENEGESDAFNLGTSSGHSVRDVVHAVETVTGRTVAMQDAPRRLGDPAVLVASSDKAKEILGWQPMSGDLTRIVKDAWSWFTAARQVITT